MLSSKMLQAKMLMFSERHIGLFSGAWSFHWPQVDVPPLTGDLGDMIKESGT